MEIPTNKIIDDAFNACCDYYKITSTEMLIKMIEIQCGKMQENEQDKKKIKEILDDIKVDEIK